MTFRELVTEFVNYQTQLLSTLAIEYPNLAPLSNVKKSDALRELPWQFELICNDKTWQCRRHGAGIWFENKSTGLVIDVHKNLDVPEAFDAWRILTFLESKKVKNYLVSNVNLSLSKREVEKALKILEVEKVIEFIIGTNLFRLTIEQMNVRK